METVGESLKNARKYQKIDLNTASQNLNISENILNDIENDQFPNHINVAFLIGHISSYAKYLNLDEKFLIDNFKIQISFDERNLGSEILKPDTPIIQFSFIKALAFVSIIIISSSFYFLFIPSNDLQPEYAMTPDIPEYLESRLEEIETKLALENEFSDNETDKINQIIDDSLQIVEDKNTFSSATTAIAALPTSNKKNLNDTTITLKFLNPTWIQLRDSDNIVIISKLMNKKDQYSYRISENLNLTAGNAGNIIILFDGVVKGKAGKFGEIIDSLIVDTHFNN